MNHSGAEISACTNQKNVAIIGTQWGDEGKGKLVDIMAEQFDYVARSTGGANAGHTIVVQGKKYVFHLLPSGLLHPKTHAVVGAGTVLNLQSFGQELASLTAAGIDLQGRVHISGSAHLLLEYHKRIDAEQEQRKGAGKIGTTCRGIGPCYADKANRIGIRMQDLLDPAKAKRLIQRNAALHAQMYGLDIDAEYEWSQIEPHLEQIVPLITDTSTLLCDGHEAGKRILFEGAQAHHLDLDHGTYPYVTSSNVGVGGFCTGLGVPPSYIEHVIGIAKAYTTRVGGGPFVTELEDETGAHLRDIGHEFGSTTGRPRRCGWFDAVAVREAVRRNGIHELCLTKIDVLTGLASLKLCTHYNPDGSARYVDLPGWSEDITACTEYTQLPDAARAYIDAIEAATGCRVGTVGVGPGRAQLITISS